MDSGNSSGTLQSSSGGDEIEESSSISAFLNNPPPPTPTLTHVGVVGPFNTSTTHMFDPLSNYLDPNPTQRSPPSLPNNPIQNLDMMWSKPGRSEPNRADLPHFLPCSSPSSSPSFLSTQLLAGELTRGTTCSAFLNTHHNILSPESGSRGLLSVSAVTNNDQAHDHGVRNPKKRSRASRRAPTTVLTTDTTNFRAMVQEFTGIPAPPFTSSSPFPTTRFDLFAPLHAAPTTSSPYLLRPFAQKLQQQHHLHNPFPPSSSSVVETLLASNNNSTNSTTDSTSINYHLSSSDDHLGLLKLQAPFNFNSMHNNPILTFQNILQQTPNYPLANSSSSVLVASKPQQQPSLEIPPPSDADSHRVFEELGLRHAHVNNNTNVSNLHHQNMVSSGNNNMSTNGSSMEWAQRTGTVNFNGEKGSECTTTVAAAARTEGMVESWINCSSDH